MSDPEPGSPIWLQLILIVIFIGINAFFAASEIALISLNEKKIEKMAEEGNKKAKQLTRLLGNSSRFLATIQIGVTLAGFLTSATAAGYLSEPLANRLIGWWGALAAHRSAVEVVCFVFITLLMSFFSLVFGELVPKRFAMHNAEKWAFGTVGILSGCAVLFAPFVRLLAVTTNGVLRLFGVDPKADEPPVTEEEIRLLVDVGEEKGVIEESQRDMLENVFEFDDITAEDLMTPRIDVEALDVTDSVQSAAELCVSTGHSRLPVYEEDIDHIVGMIHIKDLLPYIGQPIPPEVTLRSLIRDIYFAPATIKCSALFAAMSEQHHQMAVIVDEYGGAAGIVTTEDLLESIVGNIQDEFDHEEEDVKKTGERTFEVDGSLNTDELTDLLGVSLPEGDYDTLAGFLLSELGHIPVAGESTEYRGIILTVSEMDDRRIASVRIELPPDPPASDDPEA